MGGKIITKKAQATEKKGRKALKSCPRPTPDPLRSSRPEDAGNLGFTRKGGGPNPGESAGKVTDKNRRGFQE